MATGEGEELEPEGEGGSECPVPTENMDQAIIEQVRNIEQQIAGAFPLISEQEDVEDLRKDFEDADQVYQAKLGDLFGRYSHIRRTRGDGNCFFRSYGFAILEACLNDVDLLEKLSLKAKETKDKLIELGYSSYTVEDFLETFLEILEVVRKGKNMKELMEVYNNQGYSDYLVVFLRLMVSCYLQTNEEFYSAFIEGHASMKEFCSQEVEPMGIESDHIHIIALTSAINTTVQVEYMDRGGNETKVNSHRFPDDGSAPSIYLLYRPGHYDVLYPRVPTDGTAEAPT